MSTDTKHTTDGKQTTTRVDESDDACPITFVSLPEKPSPNEIDSAIRNLVALFTDLLMYVRNKRSDMQVFIFPNGQNMIGRIRKTAHPILHVSSYTSDLIVCGGMVFMPSNNSQLFKILKNKINTSECRYTNYMELMEIYEKNYTDGFGISEKKNAMHYSNVHAISGINYAFPSFKSGEPEALNAERAEICQSDGNRIIKSTQFSTFESRVRSFINANFGCMKRHEQLAEAGLCYTGVGDEVRCFSCNGVLRNWKEHYDPWTEHCKWFPSCGFARETKGEAFIERIQQNMNETKTMLNSASHTQRRPYTEDDQQIDFNLDSLTTTFVEEIGFSPKDFNNAIYRLRHNGISRPNNDDIVNEIHRLQIDEKTDASTYVYRENKRLNRVLICKICKVNDSNALLLPCAHHIVCIGCARDMKNCPCCYRRIKDVIKTYRTNFSAPHLRTEPAYFHPVFPSTEEITGKPEVVECNTSSKKIAGYTSHLYEYVIDVASLPAYTYSRTSIQGIERKCRKYLSTLRFSKRDSELLMSKDAHMFTTVTQSNILKFATLTNGRIEMKDIANKINCTYAPCAFVIELKQLHTILHVLNELQENGLEFCVLIIRDESYDIQGLDKLIVAYTSESDIQDTIDDLFERFAFSVLRKLIKQIETEASDASKQRHTVDTLHEIYQHIRAAYTNSAVPYDERPSIQEDDFKYPSNVNDIISKVLQIQGVFACFKNNGRLKIYIDETAVEIESECTQAVIKILDFFGFDQYSIFVGTLERFCQSGDPISNGPNQATLGGFADKFNKLSPTFELLREGSLQVHGNQPILVALISRHIAILGSDLKVSGKTLGQIQNLHDCHWLDIVPIDVAQELQKKCETRFRTENNVLRYAELIGKPLENRSPVHIWGAKTSPGLGFLVEVDPSESNMNIFVESRSDENKFCVRGDSGSIVCSSDRKGRSLFALAILIGRYKPSKIIEKVTKLKQFAKIDEDIAPEDPIKNSDDHSQTKNEETICMGDDAAHGKDNRTLTTETIIYSREGHEQEPKFVALNLEKALKELSKIHQCEFRLCSEKK